MALVAMLVTAIKHPSGRVELVVATTGQLTRDVVGPTLSHLGPVVLFLATILVAAALAIGVPPRHGAMACLRMANSASLLPGAPTSPTCWPSPSCRSASPGSHWRWRRALTRQRLAASTRDFHRVSLLLTPVSLVAGVLTLSLFS